MQDTLSLSLGASKAPRVKPRRINKCDAEELTDALGEEVQVGMQSRFVAGKITLYPFALLYF